jgi:hypothetical protein
MVGMRDIITSHRTEGEKEDRAKLAKYCKEAII